MILSSDSPVVLPSFLHLPDGRRIAYHLSEGKGPCVVFLGGFRSDMTGSKATTLEAWCIARNRAFLRFDYTGHGESSGNFMDGRIGDWKNDVITMLDEVVKEPCILVGSSMGGWLMLLAALARKDQVRGLVGIASAPDFTHDLMEKELTDAQRLELQKNGVVYVPDCYGNAPFPITRHLIDEGRNHLLLSRDINIDVPVRLLHGMEDRDVPWQVSQRLLERLTSQDVRLTLVKNAGHRLSEPSQLLMICHAVKELTDALET